MCLDISIPLVDQLLTIDHTTQNYKKDIMAAKVTEIHNYPKLTRSGIIKLDNHV